MYFFNRADRGCTFNYYSFHDLVTFYFSIHENHRKKLFKYLQILIILNALDKLSTMSVITTLV